MWLAYCPWLHLFRHKVSQACMPHTLRDVVVHCNMLWFSIAFGFIPCQICCNFMYLFSYIFVGFYIYEFVGIYLLVNHFWLGGPQRVFTSSSFIFLFNNKSDFILGLIFFFSTALYIIALHFYVHPCNCLVVWLINWLIM